MASTSKPGKPVGLIFVAVLLFPAALCELIVAGVVQYRLGVAINDFKSDTKQFFVEGDGEPQIPYIPYSIPQKYFAYRFSEGELAAGALSIVNALAVLSYAVSHSRAPQGRPRGGTDAFKVFVVLLLLASVVVVSGLLGWVFAASDNAGSPYFQYTPGQNQRYWSWGINGKSTWEAWTCEAANVVGGWFVTTCAYQRAARFTMIPLLVLSFVVVVLFLMAYPPAFWIEGMNPRRLRRRQRLAQIETWRQTRRKTWKTRKQGTVLEMTL